MEMRTVCYIVIEMNVNEEGSTEQGTRNAEF